MEGLGRLFNIVPGVVPVSLTDAGATGKRVSLKNAGGVTIIVFKDAGTDGEDMSFDVQQHDAASGGNSKDLDAVAHFYRMEEASLDGDETWTKTTQTKASEVAPGDPSAQSEAIYVIEIEAADLDIANGYEYVSLNVVANGDTSDQLGCVLYLVRDLAYPADPPNMAQPQT